MAPASGVHGGFLSQVDPVHGRDVRSTSTPNPGPDHARVHQQTGGLPTAGRRVTGATRRQGDGADTLVVEDDADTAAAIGVGQRRPA